jgi:hypothetical protein
MEAIKIQPEKVNAHVIKFSRAFTKLREGNGLVKRARLLQVVPVDISTLSEVFINYDTDNGLYKLPFKGWYLLLIFQKQLSGELFTTLRTQFNYQRRRGEEVNKLPYYAGLIGKEFDVMIADGKEAVHG